MTVRRNPFATPNVFRDLGIPRPEEALAKAELAVCIAAIVARRKLTQARAAEILGVSQQKVSTLMERDFTGFSIGRLLGFVGALGSDVEIIIRDRPRGRTPGRVTVLAG